MSESAEGNELGADDPALAASVVDMQAAPSRAEVRELYRRAFGGPPLNEGATEADLFSGLYEGTIQLPGAIVAISRARGRLVGICYGRVWHWSKQTDGWAQELGDRLPAEAVAFLEGAFAVHLLAVDPHRQRARLGSALLATALSESQAERAWLVTTDVKSPALRFYRARGWQPLGHGPTLPTADRDSCSAGIGTVL